MNMCYISHCSCIYTILLVIKLFRPAVKFAYFLVYIVLRDIKLTPFIHKDHFIVPKPGHLHTYMHILHTLTCILRPQQAAQSNLVEGDNFYTEITDPFSRRLNSSTGIFYSPMRVY